MTMTQIIQYEFEALIEDYKRMSRNIADFTKLQYQLAGLTYIIAFAILIVLSSSISTSEFLIILFFPPVFYAVVLVQLYLHSEIKSHSRYINFRLRPRMESIINFGLSSDVGRHVVWDWDEYYEESHPVIRFFIRSLGHVVYLLPLFLAVGAQLIFWIFAPYPWRVIEQTWFDLDVLLGLFIIGIIIFVGLINENWWRLARNQQNQ
jgi:hypothetical protein